MLSNEQSPKIEKKRLMRRFTPRERQSIYDSWQSSGLSKSKFCRKNNFPISTFSKWCQDFESKEAEGLPNDWSPVVANESVREVKGPMVMKIHIPNSTKICVLLLFLILFCTELFHAINTLW